MKNFEHVVEAMIKADQYQDKKTGSKQDSHPVQHSHSDHRLTSPRTKWGWAC